MIKFLLLMYLFINVRGRACLSGGGDDGPAVILSDREAVVYFPLLVTQLGMRADSWTNVTMVDRVEVYPLFISARILTCRHLCAH